MSHHPHLLYRVARAARPDATQVPDAELAGRFARGGDPGAFELLLWRHGPMVWGLCRGVLARSHDGEDASRPASLALARHAGSVGERGALAGWLPRVALPAPLAARKARDRRSRRECLTA